MQLKNNAKNKTCCKNKSIKSDMIFLSKIKVWFLSNIKKVFLSIKS